MNFNVQNIYRCHPNRYYYHIVKNGNWGCPTIYYRTRGGGGEIWGKKMWKHRDARDIIMAHGLGPEWKIVVNLKGIKVIEFRQSKMARPVHGTEGETEKR